MDSVMFVFAVAGHQGHREKITQRKMDGFDQKFSLNHLSNSQVQEFPCIGRQLCRQLGAGLSKEFEI